MSALCRKFGISRPTGYKFFKRYKNIGLDGLKDRSRRPYRHANKLPFQIERAIPAIKHIRPTRGAPTIRDKLIKDYPMMRLRLGIRIERIAPGHPEQNGRHERMHLTLKRDATKPASFSLLRQQSRFDEFIEIYNNDLMPCK